MELTSGMMETLARDMESCPFPLSAVIFLHMPTIAQSRAMKNLQIDTVVMDSHKINCFQLFSLFTTSHTFVHFSGAFHRI